MVKRGRQERRRGNFHDERERERERESWIGERELLTTGKFPSQEREGQR